MKKSVKNLHEKAIKLNKAVFRYRFLGNILEGLPKDTYITTARGDHKEENGEYRLPKELKYHPTKKVARSSKRAKLEEERTQALIDLRNAQEEFAQAEKEVYGANAI